MSTMSPTRPATPPAQFTLWLLAAVFVLPFVVGSGLFWSGWRPGTFVNHGELLQPPRLLPENGLRHADGRPLPRSQLLGKWLLLMPAGQSCDATCARALQQLRQVHIALNKEQSRVQRVFISTGAADPALGKMQQDSPDLLVASTTDIAWRQALDGNGRTLYLVDPLGNIMMRYGDPADMRGVLKDLERLLKYSWIR